jgi:hypothetical protein
VLRVVLEAAARELELERIAADGTTNFDASAHVTHSEEDPNALTHEQVPAFLAELKDSFPQHYPMAFLGLATGLPPSSLRPLRRKGDQVGVLLDSAGCLSRTSSAPLCTSCCRTRNPRAGLAAERGAAGKSGNRGFDGRHLLALINDLLA